MLNWRRDPDYEQQMLHFEQRKIQHELRMKQLESEILQVESETEQLRQENARLRQQRAKEKAWRTSVEQFFSQPECSSTPQATTEPDSKPSSPSWPSGQWEKRKGFEDFGENASWSSGTSPFPGL